MVKHLLEEFNQTKKTNEIDFLSMNDIVSLAIGANIIKPDFSTELYKAISKQYYVTNNISYRSSYKKSLLLLGNELQRVILVTIEKTGGYAEDTFSIVPIRELGFIKEEY